MSIPSIPSTIHRHDGHIEGHLNCVAIRHGWSRTFSMSPEEVANLEYGTLERILELSTLKLRSLGALRIYVENPAGSRIFTKVRYWKDDGSLQSNLVKDFFEARMNQGGILRFEVRDGRERSGGVLDEEGTIAAESVGSEAPGSPTLSARKAGRKKSMSFEWFSRRGPHPPDDKNATKPRGPFSIFEIFVAFAGRSAVPATAEEVAPLQPRGGREDAPHAAAEPPSPSARARTSLAHRLAHESSPFFASPTVRRSASAAVVRFKGDSGVVLDSPPPRRSVPRGCVPEDVSADGRSEIVSLPPAPPPPPSTFKPVPPAPRPITPPMSASDTELTIPKRPQLGRFIELLPPPKGAPSAVPTPPSAVPAPTAAPTPKPAPAVLSTKKLRRKGGKREKDSAPVANSHFKGADVVRRPEDAWASVAARSDSIASTPPAASDGDAKGRVMSVGTIGNLLDDDQDPFRG